MNISPTTQQAYKNNSIKKHLVIKFPEINYTVPENEVYEESMRLSESISDDNSIEFVGCISSKFQVSIRDFGQDIKGKKIQAYIYTDGTEQEPIPLFYGIVEEAKLQSNHKIKEIVAYDPLYTIGKKDVSDWYKGMVFPQGQKSIGDIWKSLFYYLNIPYDFYTTLPNDGIKIKKQYNPSSLSAIGVIKSVCQINGVFGIWDRGELDSNGNYKNNKSPKFKFLILPDIMPTEAEPYPSLTLYPPFYVGTGSGETPADEVPYYKSLEYQEFSVKPVDKIIIRQDSEDTGGSYGTGENKYIIQGNMFTLGLKKATLDKMAANIYPNVINVSYMPYTSNTNGYPWIECGDAVISYMVYDFDNSPQLVYTEVSPQGTENPWNERWYELSGSAYVRSQDTTVNPNKTYYAEHSVDVYKEMKFYNLTRNMSGIQALRDEYGAEGDEFQREFISDVGLNIDVKIKKVKNEIQEFIEDNYYDMDTIDDMFEQIQQEGWSVESVAELPPSGEDQVLYLIQGEVVVE